MINDSEWCKSLRSLEASTGIEPVYTDLQSIAFHNENNDVTAKKYQDKAGTAGEPDTQDFSGLTNENPAAATTANGAKTSIEAAKLPNQHTPKSGTFATFFWDRASNSIEPLRAKMVLT